jgi:hypothetical protein
MNNPFTELSSQTIGGASDSKLTQLDQSDADKAKAEKVQQRFSYARTYKQPTFEKWKNNIKIYTGDHWNKKMASWKAKSSIRLAYSLVESTLPLMTDRPPEILVRPQLEEDIEKAIQVKNSIDYLWEFDNLQEKYVEVVRDQLVLGTGILKSTFDPTLLNGAGEVCTHVVDPFDIFPDPNATRPDELEWVIHRSRKSLRKIKMEYGKDVQSDSQYNASDDIRNSIIKDNNRSDGVATVLEYWFYDDNGKVNIWTVANGVFLEAKVSPYEHNRLPFLWFYNVKLNGSFWGISDVETIADLQLEANKLRSITMDNLLATQNTVWLVDKTAGIKKNQITNEPGAIIEKNPGGNVERMPPAPFPQIVPQQLEQTRKDMEYVVGVFDVTKGQINSSVTAASAIQALTENSQTRIRAKLRNSEFAVKHLAELWISMISQFWTEPRIVRLTGKDHAYKFMTFNAMDLRQPDPSMLQPNPITGQMHVPPENMDPATGRPNVELITQFDVKITSGSSMLMNKSAKYQQNLELYQASALDIETLLASAEVGDPKEIIGRLIKYGVMKDPQAPSIDIKQILQGLGIKTSLTVSDPATVQQMLDNVGQQLQQMNQQIQQDANNMANPVGLGENPAMQNPQEEQAEGQQMLPQNGQIPITNLGMNNMPGMR